MKDKKQATIDITATNDTVKQMTRTEKGCGHKSHMDNYFSPPDLCDDLTELDINCCGTVSPNHKGMPDDLRSNTLNLIQEDIRNRRSCAMTAVIKDKRNVHVLTNMIHQKKVTFVMRAEKP
jgi:hypothetical protein